jgi:hypothetical protein
MIGNHNKHIGAMLSVDNWISLAAAPTFAVVAALTVMFDGGGHGMLCSAAMPMSPLSGMVPMYALMSAFHCAPWVRIVSRWQRGVHAGDLMREESI